MSTNSPTPAAGLGRPRKFPDGSALAGAVTARCGSTQSGAAVRTRATDATAQPGRTHVARAGLLLLASIVATMIVTAPVYALPCADCGGGPSPAPPPPTQSALVAGPQTDDLGQGIHMTTTVRVSRAQGRVDGHTRTWTTWWGVGGHGAVGAYLLDAGGNVIGAHDPRPLRGRRDGGFL